MSNLIRDSDGEGYYGSRVDAIDPITAEIVGHEPTVGCCLKVGTMTAGTYSTRDWWMTTPITEIISEDNKQIRFKTKNSTYTFIK